MHSVRAFNLFFMMVMGLALAACSGGKPESVLETFYRAVAAGDVETAAKQISYQRIPPAQMTQAKGKVQMLVGEMQSRIQANGGLDKVETIDVTVAEDGKTVTVNTRLKFQNGKDHTQQHRLANEGGDWKIVLR